MTYTRGEPNRNDQGLASQPKLLANNDGIDDIFGVDHYMFSSTANDRGKHKGVRFKDQTAIGDPTTAADEFALYAKEDSDSEIELFVRRPDNGTIYQLTKDNALFTGIFPAAAVNFEPDTTIQSQYNVASITDDGVGKFTVNFTTPLPDANYEWDIQAMGSDLIISGVRSNATYSNSITDSLIKLEFKSATTGSFIDPVRMSVVIFRRIG